MTHTSDNLSHVDPNSEVSVKQGQPSPASEEKHLEGLVHHVVERKLISMLESNGAYIRWTPVKIVVWEKKPKGMISVDHTFGLNNQ